MPDNENDGDLRLLSTIQLLERVSSGSEEAKNELYARYRPRLLKWARGRVPQAARGLHETEDLVQDVLARTLHNVEDFDPEHSGAFLAYVRTAMKHRLAETYRQATRRPQTTPIQAEIVAASPSPLQELMQSQTMARFDDAMEALDPMDRAAIFARVECEMSYREVADELNKPSAAAARMSVNRAVARLAQKMADLNGPASE